MDGDGGDKVFATCSKPGDECALQHPQFVYVDPSEVKPNFELTEQYTFADRMFQTHQGPSFSAHQFIISGTSVPSANSDLFASENPVQLNGSPGKFGQWGCTAQSGVIVNLIDPTGNESIKQRPCFDHRTRSTCGTPNTSIGDIIQSATIGIRCGTDPVPFGIFASAQRSKVVPQNTQLFTDIADGQLPAVSWVIPDGRSSDHPKINDGSGPSWVASIVNAIGTSQYWSNTTIFITWDDWGGFYDHVAPPIYNSYEFGFRVPSLLFHLTQNWVTSPMLRMISVAFSGSSKKPTICLRSGTRIRVLTTSPTASTTINRRTNFTQLRRRLIQSISLTTTGPQQIPTMTE